MAALGRAAVLFAVELDSQSMLVSMNAPAVVFPADPKPVAPWWHLALFVAGLAALAYSSVWFHGLARFGLSSRVPSYCVAMAAEWLLVAWVAFGVKLGGSSVSELIGSKWAKASHFFRDLGLSVAFLIVAGVILTLLSRILQTAANENIRNLLPSTLAEKIAWVPLALTAGFCEELMVRGYLQKQLHALFKSATAAVLAQGIVFGAAHAYQGWKYVVIISVLGIMLGWLAQWRRSLIPGMIFHGMQDILGGLAHRIR